MRVKKSKDTEKKRERDSGLRNTRESDTLPFTKEFTDVPAGISALFHTFGLTEIREKQNKRFC